MIDGVDHFDEKLSLCRYRAASYSGFRKETLRTIRSWKVSIDANPTLDGVGQWEEF
jgi:hypothetical protein